MLAKQQQGNASTNATSPPGSSAADALGPAALLRASSLSPSHSSSQAMDEDSLLIEIQNNSLSSSLEEQIPLHQVDIERTVPENFGSAAAGAGVNSEDANAAAAAADPSRRAAAGSSASATPSRQTQLDPSLIPSSASNRNRTDSGAASAATAGATAQGGHPIALKESLSAVPEYVKKALGVPGAPPQLGTLRADWVSYSSFYANHPVLDTGAYASLTDSAELKTWRPKGVLVATLSEHKQAVTHLSVARDNLFLVSGGEEGVVRIWDCTRLKLAAHARSQLAHAGQGRITGLTVCDSSHSVASAHSTGTLSVFKVEYAGGENAADGTSGGAGAVAGTGMAQRYVGLSEVKRIDPDLQNGEGSLLAVSHFHTLTESLLVYATQKSVHGWDLRSRKEAFLLRLEPSMGLLTALTLGPTQHCIVTGTSRGFITVWDLRFHIPVQVWRHSAKSAITHLTAVDAPSILPREASLASPGLTTTPAGIIPPHPQKGPLIFAAAEGTNQISAFDLYTGENRLLFRVLNSVEPSSSASVSLRRDSITAPGAVSAASAASASNTTFPMKSLQKVRVSPLSLPSLRSYIKEGAGLAASTDARANGSLQHFSPAASSTSGFYHSLLGVTLDDSFLKEFAQWGSPEGLVSLSAGGVAPNAQTLGQPSSSTSMAPPPASIKSFLLCKENFALTAGTDKVVRFWNMTDPGDSYRWVAQNMLVWELRTMPFSLCSLILFLFCSFILPCCSVSSSDLSEHEYLRYNSRVENTTVVLEEVLSNQPGVENKERQSWILRETVSNCGVGWMCTGFWLAGCRLFELTEEQLRAKQQLSRRTQGQSQLFTALQSHLSDRKVLLSKEFTSHVCFIFPWRVPVFSTSVPFPSAYQRHSGHEGHRISAKDACHGRKGRGDQDLDLKKRQPRGRKQSPAALTIVQLEAFCVRLQLPAPSISALRSPLTVSSHCFMIIAMLSGLLHTKSIAHYYFE
jgi:hypothetical protein